MYEELKARLIALEFRMANEDAETVSQAAEAIEQLERELEEARGNYLGAMTDCVNLERQLAERDTELKKCRDAPVVAWLCWLDCDSECKPSYAAITTYEPKAYKNRAPLIVKPGEQ